MHLDAPDRRPHPCPQEGKCRLLAPAALCGRRSGPSLLASLSLPGPAILPCLNRTGPDQDQGHGDLGWLRLLPVPNPPFPLLRLPRPRPLPLPLPMPLPESHHLRDASGSPAHAHSVPPSQWRCPFVSSAAYCPTHSSPPFYTNALPGLREQHAVNSSSSIDPTFPTSISVCEQVLQRPKSPIKSSISISISSAFLYLRFQNEQSTFECPPWHQPPVTAHQTLGAFNPHLQTGLEGSPERTVELARQTSLLRGGEKFFRQVAVVLYEWSHFHLRTGKIQLTNRVGITLLQYHCNPKANDSSAKTASNKLLSLISLKVDNRDRRTNP